MQSISITKAREKLPNLMEDVYFKSKTFLLTRRGIPMAKLSSLEGDKPSKTTYSPAERERAVSQFFGIWKNRWKGKSSEEVLQIIRKKAWRYHDR